MRELTNINRNLSSSTPKERTSEFGTAFRNLRDGLLIGNALSRALAVQMGEGLTMLLLKDGAKVQSFIIL